MFLFEYHEDCRYDKSGMSDESVKIRGLGLGLSGGRNELGMSDEQEDCSDTAG